MRIFHKLFPFLQKMTWHEAHRIKKKKRILNQEWMNFRIFLWNNDTWELIDTRQEMIRLKWKEILYKEKNWLNDPKNWDWDH